MIDVIFRDIRHDAGKFLFVRVSKRHFAADIHIQDLGHLLIDDDSIRLHINRGRKELSVFCTDAAALLPVAQVYKPVQAVQVIRADHGDTRDFPDFGLKLHPALIAFLPGEDRGIFLQCFSEVRLGRRADLLGYAQRRIVTGDLVKLPRQNIENGISESQRRYNERRTASDTGHRHPEPALIAKQVPHAHLLYEREPGPYGRDPLKKDSLAGLWCPRAHERSRRRGQRRHAGCRRGPCRGQNRQPHRIGEYRHRDHVFDGRKQVLKSPLIVNDSGNGQNSERPPGQSARQARGRRIADVLDADIPGGEAHGFHAANLRAVVFHHSRHRRERAQSCHQEEDHGKYIRQTAHSIGIHGEFFVALQRVSAQDVPLALFHLHGIQSGAQDHGHHIRDGGLLDELLPPQDRSLFAKRLQSLPQGIDLIPV